MTKKIIHNTTKHRLAVSLPMVLCALWCLAQASLPERLSHVLDVQDMDLGIKLYMKITENDLKELPDSSLFHYHYLGGYLNSEIPNHEKAISHLLAAKNLCDSKLGTYSIGYMEIMYGLGDEYIEIGKYEDALAIFQEGMVKSMAIRNGATHAFANLVIGIQECYEYMGWFNEVPNLLMNAWGFWPKDDTTLETYTYYPLWSLEQFYRRYGMYDRAISVSNEIEKFIVTNGGENHPELCDALLMKGNLLRDANKYEEAVLAYERAIYIAKNNSSFDLELLGMIYGNLLVSYVYVDRIEDCDNLLNDIKTNALRTNNSTELHNSLFTVAKILNEKGKYTLSDKYNFQLLQQPLSDQERDVAEKQRNAINSNKDIVESLPSLEERFVLLAKGSDEWFKVAYKLSCAYFLKNEIDKNSDVLKSMYDAASSVPLSGSDYYFWILGNLYENCLEREEYDVALKMAIEKSEYIASAPDASDIYRINAINDIVVAKMKTNNLEGIDSDFTMIESFCLSHFGEASREYATYLHNRGRAYQLQNKLDEAKETLLKAIAIQNKIDNKPMERTVRYYLEVKQLLSEI